VLKTFADTRVAQHVKSPSTIRYIDYNWRSQVPLACWESGLDSRRHHRNVSCECCMLSGSGLCVQRSPSECSVSECDRAALITRRPWSNRGYCALEGKMSSTFITAFYVLLTVHFGIIFVSNQLDAQFFFMYVYFHSLHVPIIRRINCIGTTSGICHSV